MHENKHRLINRMKYWNDDLSKYLNLCYLQTTIIAGPLTNTNGFPLKLDFHAGKGLNSKVQFSIFNFQFSIYEWDYFSSV
jgi:hypothetical protein